MIENDNLRNTYNPDGSDLRCLQLRMLEILKEVDRICKKHDIPYWLSSGTLLGAIRHGGFIPWDDDLDIEMLRGDYLRFLSLLPDELPDQYILQSDETDPNYVYLYAKIRDKNSYIKERCQVNQSLRYQGAFVDVFPVEPSSLVLCKISAKLFNRLCFNQVLTTGIRRKVYGLSRFLLLNLLFPFFRYVSKLRNHHHLHHALGVNFMDFRLHDEIFPLTSLTFEGSQFPVPNDVDSYLRRLYGDYWKIPDVKDVHMIDNEIKVW